MEEPGSVDQSVAKRAGRHGGGGLDEADLDPDPVAQFGRWLQEALDAGIHLPSAMTLATAGASGKPSARMVLLKGLDDNGFVFFTNYESRKANELEANPHAAAVFYWPALERQVCVAGRASRVSRQESEAYWMTRPPASRVSAWASRQSEVIASREVLLAAFGEVAARYPEGDVPLPPHWGGFRLAPDSIEFWQGRPNRLHDRLRYVRVPRLGWMIERLSP
jgi:pyridoxamine 5'-phosphate oxidase